MMIVEAPCPQPTSAVSVHVTNLLRKLGVPSRTEAAEIRRRLS